MRLSLNAAIAIAILLAEPAVGQIWANQPGEPANQPREPQPEPLHNPGPANSLGGSGATGPDSVGTLPERDTGFDRRIWRETPFPLVVQLLDALPDRMDSAAQHELAKNLLVSVADAPPGDDGTGQTLVRRVVKLKALGNVDDAAALARAAPGMSSDETMARAEIEAELLAGQVEAACIDLRAFSAVLTDPASANGLLLCRQRAGETIAGDVPPIDVDSLGPLARISGAPLPADPATSEPARLAGAARDSSLAPEQRLSAAFAAGRASAMYGESLASIFRASPAGAELPADGGAPTDGAAAATLFHAIEQQTDPAQKLSLAERGLLSSVGVADKVGVAMAQPLRDIKPAPELAALAPRFAALFYTLGDIDAATPWADLADQSSLGASLWPYRVLLKQADPVGIADWEQQSSLDPARAARVLVILSAFGVTAPPGRSAHIDGESLPEPSLADLLAMDRAAHDLHVGETVLRALAILGTEGPARIHPLALRRALADLDRVNLHGEAHALAFEAITAALMER